MTCLQPVFLLCLDAVRGSVVRYRRRPGLWQTERMAAACLAPEHWHLMGSADMRRILESFRTTGLPC